MKNSIIAISIIWFSISCPSMAADKPALSVAGMSKTELCDAAIEALKQFTKETPELKIPVLTKDQCMSIPDEDINNAVKKMMEDQAK